MSEEEARRKAEKPVVSEDIARGIAEALFGVKAASVKEMDSYDDRNFYIRSEGDGTEYTLKVHNGVESLDTGLVRAQVEVMLHLAGHGVPCPVAVATPAGDDFGWRELPLAGGGPRRHAVKLLTWVPGVIMGSVQQSPALLRDAGKMIGKMARALSTFDHPAIHREHMWDLAQTALLEDFTGHIDDAAKRATVEGIIEEFKAAVLPRAEELPKGCLQNDPNEQNLLVDPQGTRVVGVIDFGDLIWSWKVNEIAIGLAYCMLEKEDPVASAGMMLAGYLEEAELAPAEWEVLPTLIASRLACSVTMGMYAYSLDPANEYLLVTQKPGWAALEVLRGRPSGEIGAALRKAAGR